MMNATSTKKWVIRPILLSGLIAASLFGTIEVASAATGTTPSTTAVASSQPSAVFGQSVTYTATVTATSGAPASDPTGTVTFSDNATPITCTGAGNGNLVGVSPTSSAATSVASCTTTVSAIESGHTITASYAGDATYATSFGTTTQSVGKASTATTVSKTSPSGNPVTGQPVVFTAAVAVTQGAGTPTGTVTFTNTGGGSATPCSAVALSGGVATCTVTVGLVAPPVISATYSGDTDFSGSTSSSAATVTVVPANTRVQVSTPSNPAVSGQSVTFTALVQAVGPGTGTPAGSVTFSFSGISGSPTCTEGASDTQTLVQGSATCTLAAGELMPSSSGVIVSAVYGGETNAPPGPPTYNGSTGTLTETVGKGTTSTTLIVSPLKPTAGGPLTLTAVVIGNPPAGGALPGSNVVFSVVGKQTGPLSCDGISSDNTVALPAGDGEVQCSLTNIPAGSSPLKVTVDYFGDSNYLGSTVSKKVKLS